MRTLRTSLVLLGFLLWASAAQAAHTQAQLVLANTTARPGDTVLAGVHLKMESGWHTYWKNPGDAGMATKIKWELPPGVTNGDTEWPLPQKLPPEEVTTYGYENEVVLLVPLKLASDLKPGPLTLKAKVSWLECKEQCIPASAEVQATLDVGNETKTSPDAALLNLWMSKTPQTNNLFSFHARWEKSTDSDNRTLIIEGTQTAADIIPIEKADFFPDASDQLDIQGATEKVDSKNGFALRKTIKKLSGDWPSRISGVVVIEGNNQRWGFELNEPIASLGTSSTPAVAPESPTPSSSSAQPTQPLWKMLLYAFVGGLILNIMPCVLPVIALKILGFVGEARNAPGRVRLLGLVYTLGVLLSFIALAAIVIGIKSAGHRAGWGMQFGDPRFVAGLTILVVLVALNLFGVFEVNLGGRAMSAAGELASKHGFAGAFFNGVLATILATPCTAPFLSIALGFAFSQQAAIILLIFLSVGVGLALPYLVLSFQPSWLKWLPKPGAWMEKFKMFMGFPMLATAIWLFTLVSGGTDKSTTLWFGLFLIALATGVWLWGEFVQRGSARRGLAATASITLIAGVGLYALTRGSDQIQWQPWSQTAVAQAQAQGHPVLVDFTADWCLTCQVNKKVAIEVPSVRAKLKQIGSVNLVGDYTRLPDNITAELNHYSRAGVPLVLVFPGKTDAAPEVLPEVLTPGVVIAALDQAAK
ncbi:MAG TPA: protein-disulfide reductase DsbD domain-containing protein [Verrucomicrobiae bacterium]|nr:protein-disulfide reductase DsbD domain-containing protein [Verrucomicrobiae bacterium]